MKKFVLLLPLLMLLNPVAMAADQPAIGYVDVRKVLLESKLGKKTRLSSRK
jgi:Skp family chaperone for outer membrane proteins